MEMAPCEGKGLLFKNTDQAFAEEPFGLSWSGGGDLRW